MVKVSNLQKIRRAQPDDIDDLRRELAQTRELCRKLEAVIAEAPAGVYITEEDSKDIRLNPLFLRIFVWAAMEDLPLKERLERLEYAVMREAAEKCGSMRKAAKHLQMTAPTFVRKKRRYEEKYDLSKEK